MEVEEKEVQKMGVPLRLVSKWSNRFIWAAILQGIGVVAWTIPAVVPTVTPAVSRVIAAGNAGMWFTVGYLGYIAIGAVAVAVTALFYYHLEVSLGRPYKGFANFLAWVHLILMNVGVAAATWLMMYGGYLGGAAMLPKAVGGLGENFEYVHVNVLGPLVIPIGYAVIIAVIGTVAGGLGYILTYLRK